MSKAELFIQACAAQNVNVALTQLRAMSGEEIKSVAALGRNVLGYVADVRNDRHFLNNALDILNQKGVLDEIKAQHGADGFGATPWFNYLLWDPRDLQPLQIRRFDFDFPNANGARYIENVISRNFEARDDERLQNLIECGASVTQRTTIGIGGLPSGETLLTLSLLNNNPSHSLALLDNHQVMNAINETNAISQTTSDWVIFIGGQFVAQPAVQQRLKTVMTKMKEVGADIDHKYPDGSTYLGQLATQVLNGDPKLPMIQFAAEVGADVNVYSGGSSLFAILSALKAQDAMLVVINNPSFDVTTTNVHGFGVAAWAAELPGYNAVTALKALVIKGASLTMRDSMGLDIASWAALYNNKDILEYLLKQGVPPDNMTSNCSPKVQGVQTLLEAGLKPVHIAAIKGSKAALEFLIKKGHGDDLTCEVGGVQRSALDVALGAMKATVAQMYAKYNVVPAAANPINAKDDAGLTPFAKDCVADKHEDAAAKVATPGFNPNATNGLGENSLHSVLAIKDEYEQEQLIDNLIAAKADINSRDTKGATPLMKAIALGNPSAAKHLIEAKADVLIPQNGGFYPIHSAAKKDMESVVEAILDISARSATIKTSNPLKLSPIQVAVSAKAKDSLKELLSHLEGISGEESDAITQFNDDSLSALLADMKIIGEESYHGAAAGGAGANH